MAWAWAWSDRQCCSWARSCAFASCVPPVVLARRSRRRGYIIGGKACAEDSSSSSSSSSEVEVEVEMEELQVLTPPPPRQSKSKRWQWSTGTGVGEYGGPAAYMEPRPPMLRNKPDPIYARDDFIWNKSLQWTQLLPQQQPQPPEVLSDAQPPAPEQEAGSLCLSRVMMLNSLQVDLSEQLIASSKESLDSQEESANGGAFVKKDRVDKKKTWNMVSSQKQQKQWDKSRKSFIMYNLDGTSDEPVLTAAQSKKQYNQLKQKLQLITFGLGGLGTLGAYISYSPEAAASFGVGLIGSLVYLRMLCSSVDSFGVKSLEGTVRRATGQPRLLVPVILGMVYNRWNEILVPEYGFIHLELIPILLGFLTYKMATLIQSIEYLLPTLNTKVRP